METGNNPFSCNVGGAVKIMSSGKGSVVEHTTLDCTHARPKVLTSCGGVRVPFSNERRYAYALKRFWIIVSGF
ncbi:hypothetical protein AAC387_Pa05g1595 [Persea americana]